MCHDKIINHIFTQMHKPEQQELHYGSHGIYVIKHTTKSMSRSDAAVYRKHIGSAWDSGISLL